MAGLAAKKTTCSVEGCGRPHHGKGLCKLHWTRKNRTGNIQEDSPVRERQVGTCNAEGCDRPKRTKGFCGAHYIRWRKHGDIQSSIPVQTYATPKLSNIEYEAMRAECQELLRIGKKRCYQCKKVKELSGFYPRSRSMERASSWCRSCGLNFARMRKYGLNAGEFDEILKEQGYCCALCQLPLDMKETRKVHLDHHHQTGEVRGILCMYCNNSIGLFEARGLTPQFVQDYIDQKGYFENVQLVCLA